MVTNWIIEALSSFLQTVLGPVLSFIPDPPAWAWEGFDALGQVWATGHSMDAWMPVSFTVTVVLMVLAVWATTLIIGTARVVASYLTLGGGAT